jgi:crotonobetainyl-CoA:carnitine CoA-transferase CaiB-like acyl-CoA transferase
MASITPPLSGYRVIDLSVGIAGAYCTKLLADAGAEVAKIEDPGGDPLRRWSASGAEIPADADGALFRFLACTKESAVADASRDADLRAVADRLRAADAVVWSPGSRLAAHQSLTPAEILRSHPHLTVTSITPFGLTGPWHDRPATEFTLQAWSGGIVGLGRGAPDRAPVFVGGQVGEWLSGVYAAIGTLVSRSRRSVSLPGELVDVSTLEVLALCLTYYPVSFLDMAGRPYRSRRSIPTPGVEAATDGLVGLGTGTGQQWLDLCVMVGHPEWAEDQSLLSDRARVAPAIREWVAGQSVEEVMRAAAVFRIPHAPVGNGATIASTDHFQERRSVTTNPAHGFSQPDHPYRFAPPLLRRPERPPGLGEHELTSHIGHPPSSRSGDPGPDGQQLPFAGLRILDMTAFWAGPVCTHILAMLGADVIHIESPSRPDGTRLISGIPFTEDQWWERCGIFSGLNTNKKSVTLDLADERGRRILRTLLATCDVMVENFTPRVLEQIGLDFDGVRAVRPDIVMVRMPGFGLDGPWRDNAAFAFVIEDASGLTWMTGYPEANPLSPYCIGDPAAGIHALTGLLLALDHRRRTGEGVLVEAAMVDAAINMTAEQVIEYSAYGALLERDGNCGPTAAPQNLYLSADMAEDGTRDSWIAVAVATDEQWKALRSALGQPAWAMDPALLRAPGRKKERDRIDTHLSEWCRVRSSDEIVESLWSAGVPVAKVMQPHDQTELPQLQFRGFFESVDHPVTGPARHSTLPMRFSRGPDRFHVRHAPLLGEHTHQVLASIGVTETTMSELEADGVIGRAPIMATPSSPLPAPPPPPAPRADRGSGPPAPSGHSGPMPGQPSGPARTLPGT